MATKKAAKTAAKKAVKKAAKTTRQAVAKKVTQPKKGVGAKPLEGHDKSLEVIKPKKKSK